jgi:acetyltransferase-like isoleucine patch superfamily enzyme
VKIILLKYILFIYNNINKIFFSKSLRKNLKKIGKSDIQINPSTHLIIKKSKIIVENGIFKIGIDYMFGGSGFDPNKDNCRIHLNNSTLHTIGNVSLYPGLKMIAENAEIIIKNGTKINGDTWIIAKKKIEIGQNCFIAPGVIIRDNDGHKIGLIGEKPVEKIKEVIIEDNVWIGQNSIVLSGVTINNGAIIAAGSIVTKNVEKNSLSGGCPAKIIKTNITWNE